MESDYIEYAVKPNPNVPEGMARTRLAVLSRRWTGSALTIRFPDGEEHLLLGWSTAHGGSPARMQIFWTRHESGAPAVCLAIGGDAGLRDLKMKEAARPDFLPLPPERGYPLLGLAESVIPEEVLQVIGPPPRSAVAEKPLLLT